MKKKLIMVFSLVFMILLAACSGTVDVRLEIQGINGVTDADINLEQHTIEFSVSSEVESFDVANIVVAGDVLVNAYQDGLHSLSVGRELPLVDGINVYYLVLSTSQSSENWVLYITKLTSTAKSPMAITVKSFDQTYSLNEDFAGGLITVTYNDNSTEEVNVTLDMLRGFDTTTYGTKKVTIVYEGLVTLFEYSVVSDIKEIEVVDGWTKDYLVNDTTIYAGGKLKVVLDDGTSQDIDITESMIIDFDTKTAGNKELTIKYKDKVVVFGYSVHENYTSVTIENLKTNYEYGEALEGELKFILGDYSFTKPLKDYATGYDAYTYGKQTIKVAEFNLTTQVEVVKEKVNTEFSKPVVSKLTLDEFKPVYAIIMAIDDTGRFDGDEFDKAYDEYMAEVLDEEDIEEAMTVFRNSGITKEQIDKVVKLYTDDVAPLLSKYVNKINDSEFNGVLDLLKEIEESEINKVQSIIAELLTIIEPNQVTVFINEASAASLSDNYYKLYQFISPDRLIEELGQEELIELLKEAGLKEVVSFMEALDKVSTDVVLSTDGIYFMVNMGYTLIDAITKIDSHDIYDLLHYVLNLVSGEVEFDKKVLLTKIHKVGNMLEDLLVETGLLSDVEQLFDEVLYDLWINGNNYSDYTTYNSIAKLVALYGEDLISIVKNLTAEELDSALEMINLIVSGSEEELTNNDIASCVVRIAKLAEDIIVDLNSNKEAKEIAVNLVVGFASDKNFYLVVSKAVEWTTLNPDTLTKAQADDIVNTLTNFIAYEDYLEVYNKHYTDVIVKVDSTIKELLAELNDKYVVAYYDSEGNRTPIELTVNNVSGLDTKTKGWHTATVSQQGANVKIYYYVFDPANEGVISNINYNEFDRVLSYFDLNSKTPDVQAVYKYCLSMEKGYWYDYRDITEAINNISYNYYLEGAGIESNSRVDFNDVEFVVDTTTVGLKLGYIKYSTMVGDVLIPFQYYVYDSKNPTIDASDLVINVPMGDYYHVKKELLVDFGREYKYLEIEINYEETIEETTFIKEVDGIKFTINVIKKEELEKLQSIKSMTLYADASNILESYQLAIFDVTYQTKDGYYRTDNRYENFMNYLRNNYDNPSIVFDFGTYKNEYATEKVIYTIYNGKNVIYSGTATLELIPSEYFYNGWFDIYMFDRFVVDSYDEITVESVLKDAKIVKHYNYLGEKHYETEEFINECVDIKIEFEIEEGYYRIYSLYYTEENSGSNRREFRVILSENQDAVIRRDLYFDYMRIIMGDLDYEYQIQNYIMNNVVIRAERANGSCDYIYGEEAINYLNSLNPKYEININDRWFDAWVYTDNNTYYVSGELMIVTQDSEIMFYPDRNPLFITELDNEHLLEQLQNTGFKLEIKSKDWWNSFDAKNISISQIKILTDLSDKEYNEQFTVEVEIFGLKTSFEVCYIDVNDVSYDISYYNQYICYNEKDENDKMEAIMNNLNVYSDYGIICPDDKKQQILSEVEIEILTKDYYEVVNVTYQRLDYEGNAYPDRFTFYLYTKENSNQIASGEIKLSLKEEYYENFGWLNTIDLVYNDVFTSFLSYADMLYVNLFNYDYNETNDIEVMKNWITDVKVTDVSKNYNINNLYEIEYNIGVNKFCYTVVVR